MAPRALRQRHRSLWHNRLQCCIVGCQGPVAKKRGLFMKHSFRAMGLFAAVFALQLSQAATEQTKGEAEVDYRQSLYTVIAGNFHPLGAMAEGKMPFNAADAKVRADRIAFLTPMLKEAFPADSNGVGHT